MFRLGARGQMTIYVAEDNTEPLLKFAADHPIASASDITNAALRFYLSHAVNGVDGRLRPLHNGASTPQYEDQLKHVLGNLVDELKTQRRVVWTEEQRRSAKKRKD